ncbi:B-type cell cycle switch protein ccs52A-like isoform X1 [Actinidia eriantha]|uniref:B-type cell cycle switch protein ccs52A-like isoform X1 n=1 Tax=Actinidia eriantha TaxID=165200 RepID=UPI0025886131|nr:B-type cell cycle switch protein ccs52A-like isoform X1 [Actinidia eriantha]XP_057513929.1 B-type cell cycle switch protein ccs52A-like isoform X1 [Actinidia eriantha]XP_057513930.1 B-type cell cycle switch protein ccs52A-like isoform X1 [Actinidia eriantha]XP_057513931.1 B-type cell cycle switch protein ccs52A-like isoform X1 [Actinidia eriantha]XP_057513932.1 B-type cell cycle switch protein ccs52A-like isoform X1 [Actinidia eriantha]XP_057513934.1 B-type cell cycle switch protein ccs52A-
MDNPTTPSVDNQSAFRSSSSPLNLPPTISRPSLSLQPQTPSRHIDRMVGVGYQPSPSRTIYSDRFIPSRSASNFALFALSPPSISPSEGREDASKAYTALLRAALFGPDSGIAHPASPDKAAGGKNFPATPPNIFRYKSETRQSMHSLSPFGFDEQLPGVSHSPVKVPRKVPRSPYKVLDAPALQDDFYLNLVDWSSHNVLAVGLGNCVYLWNACSSKVTKLCDLGIDDTVCSVGWAQRGTHLAVGTNNGKLQIWDASRCRRVRTMEGHRLRVGAIAWNSSLLSSGSRDKSILQRDIRVQDDFVSKLTGHKSEVCGLKWSYDNRELASGGNDNRLFVWNQHSTQPVLKYCEHTAAVKAIAWSPHLHGLLASGGGTADRCIRFWNTTTNTHLSCMDTGSQVCNLVWSKNVNELVSTHGYSQNQIIVWRYPTMSKLATLTGHTYRVLYLAISPDGQTIVTGAGDETLRFWNVFPSPKSQNTDSEIGASSLGRTQIR